MMNWKTDYFEASGVDISASNIANDTTSYSDSIDLQDTDGSILGFISVTLNVANMASSSVLFDLQVSTDNTNWVDLPEVNSKTLNSGTTSGMLVGVTNLKYARLKMTKTGTDDIDITARYHISSMEGFNVQFYDDNANIGDVLDGTQDFTKLDVDNITIDGNTISSTNTNGDINLTPDGSGKMVTSKADINGGAIDGTTIGGTTPAAGTFTNVTATGSFIIGSADMNEADLEKLDGITNGTQAANKCVVADANVNTGISKITELHIGVSGSEVQVTATPLEINRTCDVSSRLVAAGSALSATTDLHDGRIILLDTAAGSTVTLPAATGTGTVLRFAVSTTATSNSHIIKVANASDFMCGMINVFDQDGTAAGMYQGDGSADDTITMNRTTTGGIVGDYIECIDIKTNQWLVNGRITCVAGSNIADPFSATVS